MGFAHARLDASGDDSPSDAAIDGQPDDYLTGSRWALLPADTQASLISGLTSLSTADLIAFANRTLATSRYGVATAQ